MVMRLQSPRFRMSAVIRRARVEPGAAATTIKVLLRLREASMTDPSFAIDRVWSIRDAILAWLYIKAMVDGNQRPVLRPDDIAATVDWQGVPLTESEVAAASDWLLEEGYLSGASSLGHAVGRLRQGVK